jgi:hypothetical protein
MEIHLLNLCELYELDQDWDSLVLEVDCMVDDMDTSLKTRDCLMCCILRASLTFHERFKLIKKTLPKSVNVRCAHSDLKDFLVSVSKLGRLDIIQLMLRSHVYISAKNIACLFEKSCRPALQYLFGNSVGTDSRSVAYYMKEAIHNNDHAMMNVIVNTFDHKTLPHVPYAYTYEFLRDMFFKYPFIQCHASPTINRIVDEYTTNRLYDNLGVLCDVYPYECIKRVCKNKNLQALRCVSKHVTTCMLFCVRNRWLDGLIAMSQICDLSAYDDPKKNRYLCRRLGIRNPKNFPILEFLKLHWPRIYLELQ